MDSVYIRYLLFFVLAVVGHYSAGFFIERIFKLRFNGGFQSHFFRLLIGVFIVVFFVATISSSGNTVMLGLGIPLLYFLIKRKSLGKAETAIPAFSLSDFWILTLAGILIYSIHYLSIYNGGEYPVLPDSDTLFYANVSNYISKFRTESLSLDFLNLGKHGCEPYHFFDIWMNTYCKDLLGSNPFLTFKFVVYPLSILIIFTGYCALAEQAGYRGIKTYAAAFLFLFFSGMYFSFFAESKYLAESVLYSYNPFSYPKLCFVYILLQATVLTYRDGNHNSSVLIFSLLPLLFITLLPAVAITVFLMGLRAFYRSRKLQSFITETGFFILVGFFIAVFYLLQPKADTVNSQKFSDVLSSLINAGYYIEMINIIGLTLIQNTVVYVPVLILVLINFPIKACAKAIFENKLVFTFVVAFFASLLCWALFHSLMDSVQLFFNISIPLIAVSAFVICIDAFKRINKNKQYVIAMLVTSALVLRIVQLAEIMLERENVYSVEYLKKTSDLTGNNYSYGGFLLDNSNYATAFARNSNFNIKGSYLIYDYPEFFSYSLTFPPLTATNADSLNGIQPGYNSLFNKFIEGQQKSGNYKSLSNSRIDFIDLYKINIVFLTKEVTLDSLLQSRISQTIIDSKTGERFCLIRH